MKKFFTVSLSFLLLIFLSVTLNISVAAAEEAATAEEAPAIKVYDPDKDIVAKVNDYEISYTEHKITMNNLMPSMAYHKSISERRQKQIEKEALHRLIMDQLFYEEAQKRSITPDKREVKKAVREFHNKLPKGMTLRKVLKQSNMTREDLTDLFKRSLTIKEIQKSTDEDLMAQAKELVTEEFMKEYYNKNLEKFKEPDKIHLSEILLKAEPGGGKKHWMEVRDQAVKIKAMITDGADFAEIAKEVSQDAYAPKGGDIGWAHSGTLTEGIEEATTSLKPGEIIGPVETLYGYHIIKLHERAHSQLKPFEELNLEKLKRDLTKSSFKRLKNEWVDSLKEKAVIVYFDAE
jgi:parvulin-like peptidyl-prolyl isomerase